MPTFLSIAFLLIQQPQVQAPSPPASEIAKEAGSHVLPTQQPLTVPPVARQVPNQATGTETVPEPKEVGPSDIIIVLDSTSSMSRPSTKYSIARWIVSDILDVVPEGVNLGILELRDAVNEFRKLEPFSAEDRPRLRKSLWKLKPAGHGEVREALQRATTLLDRTETVNPIVVLITDGLDCNCGEAHGAAAQLQEATGDKGSFFVIAPCNWGAVSEQLQSLAESGRGTFTLANTAVGIANALTPIRRVSGGKRAAAERYLSTNLDSTRFDNKSLQKAVGDLRDEIKQLNSDLATSRKKSGKAEKDLEIAQGQSGELQVRLAASDSELKAVEKKLKDQSPLSSLSDLLLRLGVPTVLIPLAIWFLQAGPFKRMMNLEGDNKTRIDEILGLLKQSASESRSDAETKKLEESISGLAAKIDGNQSEDRKKSDLKEILDATASQTTAISSATKQSLEDLTTDLKHRMDAIKSTIRESSKSSNETLEKTLSGVEAQFRGNLSTQSQELQKAITSQTTDLDKVTKQSVAELKTLLEHRTDSIKSTVRQSETSSNEILVRTLRKLETQFQSNLDNQSKQVQEAVKGTLGSLSGVFSATKQQLESTISEGHHDIRSVTDARLNIVDERMANLSKLLEGVARNVTDGSTSSIRQSELAATKQTELMESVRQLAKHVQEVRSGDCRAHSAVIETLSTGLTAIDRSFDAAANAAATAERNLIVHCDQQRDQIVHAIDKLDRGVEKATDLVGDVVETSASDLARKIEHVNADVDSWKKTVERRSAIIEEGFPSLSQKLEEAKVSWGESADKVERGSIERLGKVMEQLGGHEHTLSQIAQRQSNVERDLQSVMQSLSSHKESAGDGFLTIERLIRDLLSANTRDLQSVQSDLARLVQLLNELESSAPDDGPDTIIGPTITPTAAPVGGGPWAAGGPRPDAGAVSERDNGNFATRLAEWLKSESGQHIEQLDISIPDDVDEEEEDGFLNVIETPVKGASQKIADISSSILGTSLLNCLTGLSQASPTTVLAFATAASVGRPVLRGLIEQARKYRERKREEGMLQNITVPAAQEAAANVAKETAEAVAKETATRVAKDTAKAEASDVANEVAAKVASATAHQEAAETAEAVASDTAKVVAAAAANKAVAQYLKDTPTLEEELWPASPVGRRPPARKGQLFKGKSVPRSSNLRTIEGIGPETEEKLKKAGIKTWKKLAGISLKELRSIPGLSGSRIETWSTQASYAWNREWEKLEQYQGWLGAEGAS